MADMTVAEIRALITKHKRWDLIFASVGVFALMVGARAIVWIAICNSPACVLVQ